MPSLVTLVLPIYNMERFLAECIRSIHAQTWTDLEVIAVLDGCTDRSEEILNELKDERFVVIRKDKNEGVTAASNTGLDRARGEFWARMDADDVMDRRRLEKQVAYLRENPEVDIVGTWFDYIDGSGTVVQDAFPFPATHADIKDGFKVRNSIGGPTAMFRTERLRAVGGYDPEFSHAEDLRLFLKCLANGYVINNLPEVLYHYRQHGNQLNRVKHRETMRNTDISYREFGPRIWGKDAPDFHLGDPLAVRAFYKLKRMVRRTFASRD